MMPRWLRSHFDGVVGFDSLVEHNETDAREGLHSYGERNVGSIPAPATIALKDILRDGVMANTRKIVFPILAVSTF